MTKETYCDEGLVIATALCLEILIPYKAEHRYPDPPK